MSDQLADYKPPYHNSSVVVHEYDSSSTVVEGFIDYEDCIATEGID